MTDPLTPLEAARSELDILHTIFGNLKNGTIRAIDWPTAKRTLDYLDAKISEVQARVDALKPAEIERIAEGLTEVTNG